MSDLHPIPHRTHGSMAPMGVEREPSRESSRAPSRGYLPPEPHEKYELYPDEHPDGMDLMWLPTKIAGMPNPQVAQYYRAGWQPAAAKDFPRISGFGTEFPQAMIDAGLLETVRPDAPVVIDDQMLVLRPKELSRRAHQNNKRAADDMVANQMARLKQAYRNAPGGGVRRQHGALPTIAPLADEE